MNPTCELSVSDSTSNVLQSDRSTCTVEESSCTANISRKVQRRHQSIILATCFLLIVAVGLAVLFATKSYQGESSKPDTSAERSPITDASTGSNCYIHPELCVPIVPQKSCEWPDCSTCSMMINHERHIAVDEIHVFPCGPSSPSTPEDDIDMEIFCCDKLHSDSDYCGEHGDAVCHAGNMTQEPQCNCHVGWRGTRCEIQHRKQVSCRRYPRRTPFCEPVPPDCAGAVVTDNNDSYCLASTEHYTFKCETSKEAPESTAENCDNSHLPVVASKLQADAGSNGAAATTG